MERSPAAGGDQDDPKATALAIGAAGIEALTATAQGVPFSHLPPVPQRPSLASILLALSIPTMPPIELARIPALAIFPSQPCTLFLQLFGNKIYCGFLQAYLGLLVFCGGWIIARPEKSKLFPAPKSSDFTLQS